MASEVFSVQHALPLPFSSKSYPCTYKRYLSSLTVQNPYLPPCMFRLSGVPKFLLVTCAGGDTWQRWRESARIKLDTYYLCLIVIVALGTTTLQLRHQSSPFSHLKPWWQGNNCNATNTNNSLSLSSRRESCLSLLVGRHGHGTVSWTFDSKLNIDNSSTIYPLTLTLGLGFWANNHTRQLVPEHQSCLDR
jgi:hypothetical protein